MKTCQHILCVRCIGIACFTSVWFSFAGCREHELPAMRESAATDTAPFQTRLYDAAVREGTKSFGDLVARYPDERFYAFTLYTNNDLRGVYPFANTIEGLERSGVEPNSEEQWIAGEWQLQLDGNPKNPMADTTALLVDASDAYADDPDAARAEYGPHAEFRIATFQTLSKALLAIRESGVFRGHAVNDRIAFWVHIGDPDGDDTELMFRFVIDHIEPGDVEQLREVYGFDVRRP